jgi:hypothetical protein
MAPVPGVARVRLAAVPAVTANGSSLPQTGVNQRRTALRRDACQALSSPGGPNVLAAGLGKPWSRRCRRATQAERTGGPLFPLIAVVAALGSSLACAITAVTEQLSTKGAQRPRALPPELLLDLIRQPLWLAGIAANVASFALQVVALAVPSAAAKNASATTASPSPMAITGRRPALCSDSERCLTTNPQLDMAFWGAGGLVWEWAGVYGKEKVYGSIP